MTALNKYLAEVATRSKAATPGDWYWDTKGANWLMSPERTILSASHDGNYVSDVSIKPANAEFIAHARTDIDRLGKMLERAVDALTKTPCTGNGNIHELSCFKCATIAELERIATGELERCKHGVHGEDCFQCYPGESK
jgi:hypothetical protein